MQYLQTIKTSFKRLAHWIFEFQKYNLLIKYWKSFKIVILNTINWQSNFMKKESANITQSMLQLAVLNEYLKKNWLFIMKHFLQTHKLFTDKKLKKIIKNRAKNFCLRKLNKKKIILTHLYNNAEALFLKRSFQCNLIKWMHYEFKHLKSSDLLSVLHTKVW